MWNVLWFAIAYFAVNLLVCGIVWLKRRHDQRRAVMTEFIDRQRSRGDTKQETP